MKSYNSHGVVCYGLLQVFPPSHTIYDLYFTVIKMWTQKSELILCMFCLLITFANILDPDQAGQNVRPDLYLYPNCLMLSDGSPERIFWNP